MQSVEAMTRLIQVADQWVENHCGAELGSGLNEEEVAEEEQIKLATAICTAMLNTALPVARYRVFVKIDAGFPTEENGCEFTICAVTMKEVRASLRLFGTTRREIYITVFEQRADGADMISGYQGVTRGTSNKFDKWLRSLALIDLQNAVS